MGRKPTYSELLNEFKNREAVSLKELFEWWRTIHPSLKETTLRWRIYDLRQRGLISDVGRGLYSFRKHDGKFAPDLEVASIRKLARQIKNEFPYLKFCIWTTRWLHDLMIHQPTTSIVILEVGMEAQESAFSFLQDRSKFALIEPSPLEIERYVLGNRDYPFVVKPLVHDSPLTELNGVSTPKLEKILVDLFVESELFLPFQGQELENIFRNSFGTFNLNMTTLLAYATRRGKRAQVESFVHGKVGIETSDKRKDTL